jgi:hypothetical protein
MGWHSVIGKAGMVMRDAKPVQRMPEAKLLGASMGFAEPLGHGGRDPRSVLARVVGRVVGSTYFASGSGRSWNFTSLLVPPLPSSAWKIALVA